MAWEYLGQLRPCQRLVKGPLTMTDGVLLGWAIKQDGVPGQCYKYLGH